MSDELTPYELKKIYIRETYKHTDIENLFAIIKLKDLFSLNKDGLLIFYFFTDFNKLYNTAYYLNENNLFIDDKKIVFLICIIENIFKCNLDKDSFINLMNDLLLILNNDLDYIKILYCILIEFFIYKRYGFMNYLNEYFINADNINMFINFLYHSKILTKKIQIFTSKKDKLFFKWYSLQRKNIHHIEYNINFIDLYNLLKKRKFNKELVFQMNKIFIDNMEEIIRFDSKKEYLRIISFLSLIKK